MSKNIIDKIWDAHVVCSQEGHPSVFAIDKMLLHEVTSAQAFAVLKKRKLKLTNKTQFIATVDHSIPTDEDRTRIADPEARHQVNTLRQNAKKYQLKLYDFGSNHQGIVHVMGPELGFTLPGETIVCGDSHTSTHGAFGALAFGIGTSEVAHVLATGCLLQKKPKTLKVVFEGTPSVHVSAKDIILKLIATIGMNGATGYVIEYVGEIIHNMSMEARMTLCNMSIECGARAGLIAPDDKTFQYLKGRTYAPQDQQWDGFLRKWNTLLSDQDATYDKEIILDISKLSPMVTWGTNPEQAISINEKTPFLNDIPKEQVKKAQDAYAYTQLEQGQSLKGVTFEWAFIGSCTNGRIEDLRIAAECLRNKTVAPHVTLYVVPGSEQVYAQAEQENLIEIFIKAGAHFRRPGCSMCLGMNADKVPSGARCLSTSNRNFMGRQGPGSITHLAAPRTVALSCIAGRITDEEEI